MATTAGTEGPEWSARAAGWAEQWGDFAAPAREALAEAAGIGPGMRVLDIGCGSGELCALIAERGAEVAGIDAAEGMIEIARRRLLGAELRVGPMEQLPWDDGAFDVATAVNSLQFAADYVDALREAARVVRPGGAVAICNWGPLEHRDVDVPFEAPDQATLERAFLVDAVGGVLERLGEAEVRRRVADAAAPFRRPDGSYRFENRFRYLIAEV